MLFVLIWVDQAKEGEEKEKGGGGGKGEREPEVGPGYPS